jgi:hypothetical protein
VSDAGTQLGDEGRDGHIETLDAIELGAEGVVAEAGGVER